MARASTRLLERLAVQAQQPRVPAPAPMPRTSVPPQQSSRPSGTPARPAPAPGQGRGVRPAVTPTTPPSNGKLTLGAAVPPQVAERIAEVRAAAKPVPVPEQAKPAPAPRRVDQGTSQQNPKAEANRQQPEPAQSAPAKPKHAGPHPIERLATLYPAVFDFHAPRPLAIGIHNEIIAATGDAMPHNRIGAVLGRWTDRVNYLSATAAPGSRRFHLDGSDAGEVTEEHRAIAATRLAEKIAIMLPEPSRSRLDPAKQE